VVGGDVAVVACVHGLHSHAARFGEGLTPDDVHGIPERVGWTYMSLPIASG